MRIFVTTPKWSDGQLPSGPGTSAARAGAANARVTSIATAMFLMAWSETQQAPGTAWSAIQ